MNRQSMPTFREKYNAANNYIQALNNLGPSECKFGPMTFTNKYNQGDKDRNMKALTETDRANKALGEILKKK